MSIDWETSRRIDLLAERVAKFDARLSALEAAQKKPDAPTPEQREPGWYWVYDESGIKNIMHFYDGKWATQEQFWHRAMPLIRVISPRIQEPGE